MVNDDWHNDDPIIILKHAITTVYAYIHFSFSGWHITRNLFILAGK